MKPDLTASLGDKVRATIRDIPDFPKPGIIFKDITPVLAAPELFAAITSHIVETYRGQVDAVVGIESRGFILGAPVALGLQAAFIPIRKPGKLPYRTRRVEYELEYGTDALEAHEDAARTGQRVLIVDDVLATGGTAAAAGQLVRELGATVAGMAFLIELGFLGGRARLGGVGITSIVQY